MRPLAFCRLAIGMTLFTSVLLLFYHSNLYRHRFEERDPWASRLMKIVLPKSSKVERVSAHAIAQFSAMGGEKEGEMEISVGSSRSGSLRTMRYFQMLKTALTTNLEREYRYNRLDADLESKRKPMLVIIVAYWRSGSSFLGELINQYPGVFYTFEPFHNISMNAQIRGGRVAVEGSRWLANFATCRYENLVTWLGHVQQRQYNWLVQHNLRLWRVCRNFLPYCYDADFNSESCRRHKIRVVKAVRLRLNLTRIFLDGTAFERPEISTPVEGERVRVKVIHLVRDPRAMAVSREDGKVAQWCKDAACVKPGVVCQDMEQDLVAGEKLKQDFPRNFLTVKYEDLGRNATSVANTVLKFLGLTPEIPSVEKFLRLATSGTVKKDSWTNPYSVIRDSSATVNAWRSKISRELLDSVQKSCGGVLRRLGYERLNPKDFPSVNSTLFALGGP